MLLHFKIPLYLFRNNVAHYKTSTYEIIKKKKRLYFSYFVTTITWFRLLGYGDLPFCEHLLN